MAVSYGTYTITEVQEGSQIWTTTVAPVSPDYTFAISNLTGDSDASVKIGDIIMYSYYRYTVLSVSNDETTVLTGDRVSIRGATAQWYYGEALTHISGNTTLPISQTNEVTVGAMYLNVKTGACYKCTAISGSNATWTYAGNITDGISIGGRNLLYQTGSSSYPITDSLTAYYVDFTFSNKKIKNAVTLEEGVAYTFSLDITSSVEPFQISVGTGTGAYLKDIVTLTELYNGRNSITFVPTAAQLASGTTFAFRAPRYSYSTTFTYSVNAIKLEKGNKATDWTPAPEDIEEDIEEAKKVATNYLSVDSTGIMIADLNDGEQTPSEATGNNVFIDNTSVNIRDGQTTLASFGIDGMQIGLSDESHTTQDYHSWKMIDKEGNTYVHISDLRDTTGWAIFEESYVPIINYDGSPPCDHAIELAFPINSNSDIISAEINGTSVESWEMLGNVRPTEYIQLTPLPSDNDNVTIKYKSSNSALKAYTFGTRQDGSVLGGFSFAEGYNTVARGRYSHSEGYQCKAIGYNSHAEGYNTTAKGRSSHAENSGDAYGDYSHAEGNAITYGHHSHAEGASHASGEYSHSEGYQTGADGNYSHAQNFGTQAKGEAQTAIGKFNIEDNNNTYALIVGNGADVYHRSNALTVDWNGHIVSADGFNSAMPPFKWKSASYTASNLASGYTDVTTNVSFPTLTGYARTIMVVGTNSAYTGATGAYIDSNNKVHIRCRNFASSASSPTISFIMIYLNESYTWT